jgi:hypothetical protein
MRFRLEIDMLAQGGATEVVFPEALLQPRGRKAADARYGPLIIKRGLTASRDQGGMPRLVRIGKARSRSR